MEALFVRRLHIQFKYKWRKLEFHGLYEAVSLPAALCESILVSEASCNLIPVEGQKRMVTLLPSALSSDEELIC